jgi:hypothetical protein
MKIDRINVQEANSILEGGHYLGPVIFPPRYCFATPERDAVAVYSFPMAAAFKVKFAHAIELARLWCSDAATIRTDHFLARSLQALREHDAKIDCVFTYADPSRGHTGAVYKGCGFTFLNEQTRVTDQWRTPEGETLSSGVVYRLTKTKRRDLIMERRPDLKLIAGVPKLLFVKPMRMKIEEIRAELDAPRPDDRRKLFSKAYGGFRVASYQDRFPAKKCAYCHRLFLAARSDARTCSPSCRTMLSRRRHLS